MAELLSIKSDDVRVRTKHVLLKVGMIGESQTGKTSLMVRYVQNIFAEDYIETLGVNYMNVNFMEKTVRLRNVTVTLNIWDLGGQKEYLKLMPLVCKDAQALLFVFDLTRKKTLSLIREWYRKARRENKNDLPFLVGAKYDLFEKKDMVFRDDINAQARKFSKGMKAPLLYTSSATGLNIKQTFQLVVANNFHLRPKIQEEVRDSEPLLEWKIFWVSKIKRSTSERSVSLKSWKASSIETKEDEASPESNSHLIPVEEVQLANEEKHVDEGETLILDIKNIDLGTVNIEYGTEV